MRPLSLILENFACFRGRVEIDFRGLDLYAIVGPTGSGKSSILDALCFALYGKTPRLGSKGMDSLITQGEQRLTVALDCLVGTEHYRVTRTKGRKASESELRVERCSGAAYSAAFQEIHKRDLQQNLEAVIGLDFEAFTRAVLLPQGQFDRFLRGTASERQELLGALLDLAHVQAMHERAQQRARTLAAELSSRESLLGEEYREVHPELLEASEARREQLAHRLELVSAELLALESRLEELRQRADWGQRLQVAGAALDSLLAEAAEMERYGLLLERCRKAGPLWATLEQLGALERRCREVEDRWQASCEPLPRLEAEREAAARALADAQARSAEVADLQARLRSVEQLQGRLLAIGKLPDLPGPTLPYDQARVVGLREAAGSLQLLTQQEAELRRRQADLEGENRRLADLVRDLEQLEARRLACIDEGKRLRAQQVAVEPRVERLRKAQHLAGLHGQLRVGEPCPLCGQVVTAPPPQLQADALSELEAYDARAADLARLQAEYRGLRQQVERERLRLERERERVAAKGTQQELAAELLEVQEALRVAAQAQGELSGVARGLRQEISRLVPGPLEQAQAALAGQIARIEAELWSSTAAYQRSQEAYERQVTTAELRREQRDQAAAELGEQQAAAEAQLAELGLSRDELAQLPSQQEQDALRARLARWEAERAQLSLEVESLRAKLGETPFDPAEWPSAKSRAEQIAQERLQLNNQLAATSSACEQLRARLQRKAELERQQASLRREHETWTALQRSLQRDAFQRYLLEELEAELLDWSGQLLYEISDSRYRLRLEDGEYQVIDHWNAAEARSVKTLSGGETFQASLALAIALSDRLAGSRVLGALFLDEGFGALDPQALELVTSSLERLRSGGRMVGVVTHVASLAERLPATLRVQRDGQGSQVTPDL
jgi:exonuclease SbcC